ncbi:hypothetical protein C7B64_06520 [Merismopedia glauca CCAP 1448/3]|uniref:ARG and Rhodanese-Phosphatase-superfamily-associated domain-containing protein n=2 Tax=Merismopedia TaxID=53402 RepID=A0A2T1C6U3_9CYAN|nr:hypothetical protein C7B64_06520 [Merismopedia glauca CCAP 1448/3]
MPQKSGCMTVVPIFNTSNATRDRFCAPLTGLKLSAVRGYGNMELTNHTQGIAIAPLHMGYIQDKAQNHALCRSAFIASGQKLMFEDACCVQAAQGGYLTEKEQWFFILPLQLREEALSLQGIPGYSKLWAGISRLNQQLNLPNRGHLEQIISNKRAYLTQYQSRFELIPNQIGALFLIHDKLVGLEIAPNPAYFAEVWMPLVCFSYGVAAMQAEMRSPVKSAPVEPFIAQNLQELRQQLSASRSAWEKEVQQNLTKIPPEKFDVTKEEKFLNLNLQTLNGSYFAGQIVQEVQQLVYASIFAKSSYLEN